MIMHRGWVLAAAAMVLAGCDGGPTDNERRAEDDAEFRTFISPPDMGGGDDDQPCRLGLQDCPAGEKCNPYALSGWFKDHRCVPVADDPKAVGEPCQIAGIVTSGLDDCERGSYCQSLSESLTGTCVAHQVGDPGRFFCVDPLTTPLALERGVLAPCQPTCNPLAPDCAENQACRPVLLEDRFTCQSVAVGPPTPAQAACRSESECIPGTACLPAADLPTCTGFACCASYCNTSAPACPDGTACVPWYEDDDAPPGLAELGVCR